LVLQSLGAAEITNIRYLRDFRSLSIFDFFNSKSAHSLGPVDYSHEFNDLINQRQERLLQQAFANLVKRARVTAAGEAMR
jgi:hypothetical protein